MHSPILIVEGDSVVRSVLVEIFIEVGGFLVHGGEDLKTQKCILETAS